MTLKHFCLIPPLVLQLPVHLSVRLSVRQWRSNTPSSFWWSLQLQINIHTNTKGAQLQHRTSVKHKLSTQCYTQLNHLGPQRLQTQMRKHFLLGLLNIKVRRNVAVLELSNVSHGLLQKIKLYIVKKMFWENQYSRGIWEKNQQNLSETTKVSLHVVVLLSKLHSLHLLMRFAFEEQNLF